MSRYLSFDDTDPVASRTRSRTSGRRQILQPYWQPRAAHSTASLFGRIYRVGVSNAVAANISGSGMRSTTAARRRATQALVTDICQTEPTANPWNKQGRKWAVGTTDRWQRTELEITEKDAEGSSVTDSKSVARPVTATVRPRTAGTLAVTDAEGAKDINPVSDACLVPVEIIAQYISICKCTGCDRYRSSVTECELCSSHSTDTCIVEPESFYPVASRTRNQTSGRRQMVNWQSVGKRRSNAVAANISPSGMRSTTAARTSQAQVSDICQTEPIKYCG